MPEPILKARPYPFASKTYQQKLGIPMLPSDYTEAVSMVSYLMEYEVETQAEAVELAVKKGFVTEGEAEFIFGAGGE